MTSGISGARALVLDFGGVISRTMFETHDQTEVALGLPKGTLTWRGPFDPAQDALWRDMLAGTISERGYWLTRAREVGALVGEKWNRMETLVNRARGAEPSRILRPEAVAIIEAAHAAGHRLAILSNELDLFYGRELRERIACLKLFDVIVDATYTGCLKPDPAAYQSCLDALKLPAAACVFVDDQDRNVQGAHRIGMQAILFDVRQPAVSFADAAARLGIAPWP